MAETLPHLDEDLSEAFGDSRVCQVRETSHSQCTDDERGTVVEGSAHFSHSTMNRMHDRMRVLFIAVGVTGERESKNRWNWSATQASSSSSTSSSASTRRESHVIATRARLSRRFTIEVSGGTSRKARSTVAFSQATRVHAVNCGTSQR